MVATRSLTRYETDSLEQSNHIKLNFLDEPDEPVESVFSSIAFSVQADTAPFDGIGFGTEGFNLKRKGIGLREVSSNARSTQYFRESGNSAVEYWGALQLSLDR